MKTLLLSLLGLINAIWLVFIHFLDFDVCKEGFSCAQVVSSPYGVWLGMPVAVFGACFFVFCIVNRFLNLGNNKSGYIIPAFLYTGAFISALYFLALQLFVIKALCFFCVLNHILVFVLVVSGSLNLLKSFEKNELQVINFKTDLAFLAICLPLLIFQAIQIFSPIPRLQPSSSVEATLIEGRPYTTSVLDSKNKLAIYQNAMDLYQIRKNEVDKILIEKAAKNEGLSIRAYYQKNIFEKIQISQSDIDSHLEKHKSELPAEMPLVQKRRIAQQHIQKEKMDAKRQSLLDILYDRFNVQLNIPKPSPFEVIQNPVQEVFKGKMDAKIKLVMFSDFQCPACKDAKVKLDELFSVFPEVLKIIYRHYPLNFHPLAKQASKYSVCLADQDQFFTFSQQVFANQKTLTVKKIRQMAQSTSADMTRLDQCLASDKPDKVISIDQKEADRLGLNATPFILVNGQVFKGVPSKIEIQSLLDSL